MTNLIGIVAVAILVFVSQRYGEWKKVLLALLLVVGLSALLIQPLSQALHRLYVKNRVVGLVAELPHIRPDIVSGRVKFDSINVTYRDGLLHINVDGFLPRELLVNKPGATDAQERVDLFHEYLSGTLASPWWWSLT